VSFVTPLSAAIPASNTGQIHTGAIGIADAPLNAGNNEACPDKENVRIVSNPRKNQAAFTLVEIMIVVSIIGLLTVLAIPSFVKARKQAQGRRAMNDVRQIDAAIDQWALEMGLTDGATIVSSQAATYLKPTDWEDYDPLGNAYVLGKVGTNQIRINSTTKSALAGVGIDWGAY
jgi:prepilin-type N-terminal cleavage/methylation domain-containing protein